MIGGPAAKASLPAGYYEGFAPGCKAADVEFTGFLPLAQVEPWFDRARVLVSTSLFEGMPNVFLQAWARGVPIVCTVDVGVPVNRVVGEVDEAVRQIELLFEDQEPWSQASSSARYFGATHSPERVLRSTENG
jgi:glycosyltransferase involved in cell wall biosynthesis